MASLSAEEIGYFDRGGLKITDQYNLGAAQNLYQRGLAGQQYSQNQGSLVQQFADLRNKVPGGFGRRGMLNSGLYAQALGQFGQQRDTALGNLAQNYQGQIGGFDLADNQLGYVRNASLNDLERQKADRIAALAGTFRG